MKSELQPKPTVTQLAKQLAVSTSTTHRLLRQYPKEAPPLNEVEKWRSFALAHVVDPDAICRLAR